MARLFPLAMLMVSGCSGGAIASVSPTADPDPVDQVAIELPALMSRRMPVDMPEPDRSMHDAVSPHEVAAEPIADSGPVVEFGHRQYGIQEICDGAPRRFAWVDERAPTAAELTAGSVAEVRRRLPTPLLVTSPESAIVVNLDAWLGIDDLEPLSAGIAADGHHARVTATPMTVDYLSPNGSTRCIPGPPRASCTITIDRRGQTLPITTRVTWAITYSSSVGDGRLAPLVTESVSVMPVEEIQTISR